jgi:GDP-L-fucose synthase
LKGGRTVLGFGQEVDDIFGSPIKLCVAFLSAEPFHFCNGHAVHAEFLQRFTDIVGFEGRIEWDTTKPDGQMVKIFDTSRLAGLGLSCRTTLREGLKKTIEWFAAHYDGKSDGLRI